MRQVYVLLSLVLGLCLGLVQAGGHFEFKSSISLKKTWERISTLEGVREIANAGTENLSKGSAREVDRSQCGQGQCVACPVPGEDGFRTYASGTGRVESRDLGKRDGYRYWLLSDNYDAGKKPTVRVRSGVNVSFPGTEETRLHTGIISDEARLKEYFNLECVNGALYSAK